MHTAKLSKISPAGLRDLTELRNLRCIALNLKSLKQDSETITMASAKEQTEQCFSNVLEAVSEYLELQASLSGQLKLGFFDLARSKYSLGPGSVSQTQYDNSMQATTLFQLESGIIEPPRLRVDRVQTAQGLEKSCSDVVDRDRIATAVPIHSREEGNIEKAGLGVLSRDSVADQGYSALISELAGMFVEGGDGPRTESESEEGEDQGEACVQEDVEHRKRANPLQWFGVMIPQSLRDAQSGFSGAVDTIAQLANKANYIKYELQRYKELSVAT